MGQYDEQNERLTVAIEQLADAAQRYVKLMEANQELTRRALETNLKLQEAALKELE